MLLFVLAYGAPSSAVAFVIYKLFKTKNLVMVARTDAVRAGALVEGAERAAQVAEAGRADAADAAREALGHLGEALAVARGVETVSEQVQGLTDYLVAKIEGEPPRRGTGRHAALPDGDGLPAIAGGAQEGGLS